MRIYNSDGSEPEMCGNGIRCLARFVAEKDNAGPRQYKVSTGAGQSSMQSRTLYSLCVLRRNNALCVPLLTKAPHAQLYYQRRIHLLLTYAPTVVQD